MSDTAPQLSDLSKLNNELANLQREVAQRNAELEAIRDALATQVDERTRSLAETVDDLVRAMKVKDAFFTRMSHDLRTPLNSIIGFSSLLLEGYVGELNEEQKAQVGMINASGQQLLALVSDILELSDLESEHVEPCPAHLSVSDVVESALCDLRPVAEERGLAISFTIAENAVTMYSDAELLRRVLHSMLSNALEYTEAGHVRLEVTSAGSDVEFRVKDTGIGIAPSEREIIFEAFVRGTIEDPVLRPGSGIGLAIARQLAEGLGGFLTLEHSDECGSTFLLSVPGQIGT